MTAPTEHATDGTPGYRFGPRDQRGLVAGVRTGQACVLAASLVLAVVVAHARQGMATVPAAALVALAGGLLAFVPLGGRTADEWAPLLVAHAATGLTGARRHRLAARLGPARRAVPRPFRGLQVVEVAATSAPAFGAVADARQATLTGVLSVAGGTFALADHHDQARRVAAWSSVLGALGGGNQRVARIQWVERTVPEPAHARPAALGFPEPDAPGRSYRSLLRADPGRLRHELLVAVSVRAPRGRLGRRPAAGRPGAGGAARDVDAVLARELAALERRLREAGVAVEGALSPEALRTSLRAGFEPGPFQGPPPRQAWPFQLEARWSRARVGRLVQATYWIAEWPRSEVGPDFLLPLLLAGDERRSLSLVMSPVPPGAAVRAAEHARTSGAADAELRARHGFALSARARGQQEAVAQREAELAAGYAAFRFSGYVAVAAHDEAGLSRACARIEQAAALARLTLRRLDGCQADALTVCLPLGRGCA